MSDDTKVLTPDEVKESVINELGLDPEDETNKGVIDKVVNSRLESQKALSKAIEQKANYRKLAIESGLIDPNTFEPIKKEINKTNETQSGLSREEAILYAKGLTDEEVELAKKLSVLNGVTPLKAIEDDIFKAKYDARIKKEKSEKAALAPSNGLNRMTPSKPTSEMTEEEHRELHKKLISG